MCKCKRYHHSLPYLRRAERHDGSRWKVKSKSRSFRVVVSSISILSADRPSDDPFKSNLRWILNSVQNTLPITTNRTFKKQPPQSSVLSLDDHLEFSRESALYWVQTKSLIDLYLHIPYGLLQALYGEGQKIL